MQVLDVTESNIIHSERLLSNINVLSGVGPQLAAHLAKLSIHTIIDLLLHLPYKYLDKTRITNIVDLQLNTHAVIQGKVISFNIGFTRARKRSLTVYLQDNSGMIELRFFQFNKYQLEQFQTNPTLKCFGEIKYGKDALCIFHPEYKIVNQTDNEITEVAENLTPVYPSTEGLSQNRWLRLIEQGLNYLGSNAANSFEYLPAYIREKYGLLSFTQAIKFIHHPTPDVSSTILENKLHAAQQRLIFDELLANQLAMSLIKLEHNKYHTAALANTSLVQELHALLPFKLTNAQKRVAAEIAADLSKPVPMSRLLQGDVGSGKTIVAAIAILQVVGSGYQAALMAPTEILAEQHYHNLSKYFTQLGVTTQLLTAKQPNKLKQEIKYDLANNKINVIIGTHALIQNSVEFAKLGLIIIDEQHRFGVEQRMSLWQKGATDTFAPHQLTMTATPIPRTLAMTIYADMDYSVIDELPPGRKPIITVAISEQKRSEIISRIFSVCAQGNQVYWVCTLIEESEVLSCQAAEESYKQLSAQLIGLRVGLVHGRMNGKEKSAIMADFKSNKIQVLVATTVIEVGVDVPNANLMIIENPERLGLSQLHQLRGRVGRGGSISYCVMLYTNPLSAMAQARLNIMRDSQDGFRLAEFDLQMRGSGELLGKRQTGGWHLKIADLVKDRDKLPNVRAAADYLNKNHPETILPLIKLWLRDNYKLGSV